MIWLLVTDDAQSPTAEKAALNRKRATYEPIVPATSKFPVGFPKIHTIYIYKSEGMRIVSNKNNIPTYFPKTICNVLTGLVNNKANIPLRFSSEIERIVKAGTKNTKIHDEILKNGSKSANPLLNML